MNPCGNCGRAVVSLVVTSDEWNAICWECQEEGRRMPSPESAEAVWNEANPIPEPISPEVASQISVRAVAAVAVSAIRTAEADGPLDDRSARAAVRKAIGGYFAALARPGR